MGFRLYRYADKGEFRVISTGSCLLSGITGGTRHWFASPVCPLQARPACRSRTASCYITCVRYCMYYSLRARPTLVASVTIVISCSCRTRTAKSDNNVYSKIKYSAVRDYFCAEKNIPQSSRECTRTWRINFSYISFLAVAFEIFVVFSCCTRMYRTDFTNIS